MKPMMEFSAFLGLAFGAHVMIWAAGAGGPVGAVAGPESGGVVLAGSSPSLQSMVADWDRPPSVSPEIHVPVMDPSVVTAPAALATVQAPPAMLEAPPLLPTPRMEKTLAPDSPPPPQKAAAKPAPKPAAKIAQPKASSSKDSQKAKTMSAGKSEVGGGTAAKAATKTSTKADPKQMARWGGAIRSSIERRKKYPAGTHAKGTVSLAITVANSGALAGLTIAKSSGDARLDRAAMEAVKRARLPKAPAGIPAGSHRFTLSVSFD